MQKWFLMFNNLLVLSFLIYEPSNFYALSLQNYEPWFPEQNITSDWKNIYYSNFISTNYDKNLITNNNVNLENARNYVQHGIGNNVWNSHGFRTIGQINIKNFAENKNSFINNYRLQIDFALSYNSWTNDWGWNNPIHGSDGTNLRFQNRHFDSEINHDKENKFDEFIEHGRKTHSQLSFAMSWNGDWLDLKVKLESKSWWNWGSWIHHAAIISFKLLNIKIVSKFSENNFENQLKRQFDSPFTLNTKTSPLIGSDIKESVNGLVKSNREIISEEIEKRLRNFFDYDYNEWKRRLSWEKQYLNGQNIVKITFIDANNNVPGDIKKLFNNLNLKVKVNFLPEFWQKSLKERLEIIPGKIVNPKNSEHELITDNPEFIKESGQEIYVYHNSVKLTFSSTNNSGEILFVNGKEVEVYENIFKIDLLDKGSKKENDNTYQIVVKVKNIEKMKLTIKIVTEAKDTTFKWLGWNPENNPFKPNEYKQYRLITPKINGEKNEDYDHTINAKTGLRNQMIFVNQKSQYPFPLNPLDKFGRLIKENKNDYIQGYIAEAMVANSGIQNIFDEEELKTIDKIERLQIDPKTFNTIGNSQVVDVKQEMQFSMPGLWHYIFHIKDYVDKKVDPKETNYQVTLAKAGSTMHKFVLIGNQHNDYAEFLKQQDIFNNEDLEYFWSSTAGKHLKSFLKNERNISLTEKINQLEYKEIIRYWKEYVSSAAREQIDRKEDFEMFDLSSLHLENLRVNTNDKNVLFKNINKYLNDAIKKYASESIYGIDYYVTNSFAENIHQIQWQNFLNISNEEKYKKIDLIVTSSHQSLYIKGKTKLTIINDYKYDEKKLLDLDKVKIKDIVYNFFASDDEIKQSFKNNYILSYINNFLTKQKPKNVSNNYIHKIDYEIFIEFPDGQKINIFNDKTDQYLKLFLDIEKFQTLKIEILSIKESYLLIGKTCYEITNDPDGIIAPPEPKIDDKDEQQLMKNLMWIIPTVIGGILLIGLISFFVSNRLKRKIK